MKDQNIKVQMDLHMVRTLQALQEAPWESKEFYAEFLAQSYYYTSYSTRLLAMAAALSGPDEGAFFKRSIQHISEEHGHDRIALTDLKRLGSTIENHRELGLTRTIWEAQFWKVQRAPTSLLG